MNNTTVKKMIIIVQYLWGVLEPNSWQEERSCLFRVAYVPLYKNNVFIIYK